MKKIFVCLATLILLLGIFSACGAPGGVTQADYDKVVAERDALQKEIDVLKGTPESEETTTASTGVWTLKYYVDEFDKPTSKGYVSTAKLVSGTFSNSATSNSKLSVLFIVDKDGFAIALNEYGSSRVKNSSSRNGVDYNITFLSVADAKVNFSGTMNPGSDRIQIAPGNTASLVAYMSEHMGEQGEVSFYIEQADRTTTTYLFSVETSNFAEEYGKL